jgi:hypothetical protein
LPQPLQPRPLCSLYVASYDPQDYGEGILTLFYLWVLHPVAHLSNWFCMMPSIAKNFNTLTPFYFLCHSLNVSAPTGHLQVRYTIKYLHLQHRQHTSHEEETSNNRRKTKSLQCPRLEHYDADGLAGHKTWRTTQTTMRRYKCSLLSIF